jgi:hypothetical protein
LHEFSTDLLFVAAALCRSVCVRQFPHHAGGAALSDFDGTLGRALLYHLAPFNRRRRGSGIHQAGAKLDATPLAVFPHGKGMPDSIFSAARVNSRNRETVQFSRLGRESRFHRFAPVDKVRQWVEESSPFGRRGTQRVNPQTAGGSESTQHRRARFIETLRERREI